MGHAFNTEVHPFPQGTIVRPCVATRRVAERENTRPPCRMPVELTDGRQGVLTYCRYCDRMHNMKPTPPENMTERLRRAVAESDLSMLQLAKAAGVERTALLRFARGSQSILLANADRLAEYFGLRLVEDPDAAPAEPPARRRRSRTKGETPARRHN